MTAKLIFTSDPSMDDDKVDAPSDFTGVVFDPFRETLEVQATWMIDGQPVGEGFPFIGGDESIVSEDWLEQDPDGNVLLDGKPYRGYVVRNTGGDPAPDCLEACYWICEEPTLRKSFECNWYESGAILLTRSGNIIEWDEEGWLHSHSAPIETCRDESGEIRILRIEQNAEPGTLRSFPSRVAPNFSIYGNVRDEDLTLLLGLEEIEKLHIVNSQITGLGLEAFKTCKKLRRFTIRDNQLFKSEDAEKIADLIEGCDYQDLGKDGG